MIITLSQPLFSRLTDMYTIREVFTVRNSKKNPPKIQVTLFDAEASDKRPTQGPLGENRGRALLSTLFSGWTFQISKMYSRTPLLFEPQLPPTKTKGGHLAEDRGPPRHLASRVPPRLRSTPVVRAIVIDSPSTRRAGFR